MGVEFSWPTVTLLIGGSSGWPAPRRRAGRTVQATVAAALRPGIARTCDVAQAPIAASAAWRRCARTAPAGWRAGGLSRPVPRWQSAGIPVRRDAELDRALQQ